MTCPYCGSVEWRSKEKNKDGVNMKVECLRCHIVYATKFSKESLEERLADSN